MNRFLGNSTTSGILLFASAAFAMILSNSPWKESFHHIWEIPVSVGFGSAGISKSLHHWINDGLMAVFFFVIGLELKREIVAGELRHPRNALLPVAAALGGMAVPAMIYTLFNQGGAGAAGWGIPMATDIAFALGVLYLLGDRVPLSLKVFLTALAITDDLGAVLVIAFFYTSEIHVESLMVGGAFLAVLIIANRAGVRHPVFYGIFGIGGLWVAFLMSGVHATIAAVLAAFTIPATVKVSDVAYSTRLGELKEAFRKAKTNDVPTVSHEQQHVIEEVRTLSKKALTPLQQLEHAMHPLVAFVIMPVFALANAGVTLSGDVMHALTSHVAVGVFAGLLIGKLIGVVGVSWLLIRLRIAPMPEGMNMQLLTGTGILAGIGFTMSLFIASLAFEDPGVMMQAKLGILCASVIASITGYLIVRNGMRKERT
ncbi:MAG: Na+/H+ antiporter NhaA [Flavobacteriales bacterium]